MIGFKTLVRIAALTACVAVGTPAQAAVTLTFPDLTCNGMSMVDNGNGNFTLNCLQLACTATATPPTQTPGLNVAVAASCTGVGGVNMVWTPVAGNDLICPANLLPSNGASPYSGTLAAPAANATVANCSYKVVGTDASNQTGTKTVTVGWSVAPPPAPTGCTIGTTTANLPNTGGTAVINLNCTGQAATSWIVRRNGVQVANPSGNQVSVNDGVPAGGVNATTYTYTAVPDNGGTPGSTTPANVTVTVAGSGGGGGGNCGMTTKDLGAIAFDSSKLDFDLGDGTKEVAVAYYTATAANQGKTTELQFYEYFGGPIERTVWVSKVRCEMTDATRREKGDTAPSIGFSVNGPSLFNPQINMAVGETWYVMIRNLRYTTNFPSGKNSCIELPCATRMSGTLW